MILVYLFRKSIGLTASKNFVFLNENHIAYASGNSIITVDITDIRNRNKKGANTVKLVQNTDQGNGVDLFASGKL